MLKEKLLDLKKNLSHQLGQFAKKDDQVENNYISEFPDQGREPDDDTPKEYENYERRIGVEQELEEELQKVNRALEKIENDTNYGICENCGEPIAIERLKIRPHAVKCIKCKKK
ncbi:MAG: hypothetical protein GF347_00495 [Candidatus Moranbacteria bacterium]|nr:hypothetical protein [Candidatus Moranbacteria bacterium]